MHPLSPGFDPDKFHQDLAHFNAARVSVGKPSPNWQNDLQQDLNWRLKEGHYLEHLRLQVAPMLEGLDAHTGDTDHFVAWFEALALTGPGQQHPLFDWLAGEATLADMHWFLTQEAAGEAGFDDLVAYAQVKLPAQAKLECARNYWDEMGHGKESAMHGQMLDRVVQDLALKPSIETTVWESLALSNTMLGLAMNRRYAYHALGALGAIELTAPGRVANVSAGMKRLGLPARTRAYFDLHAALDVSHARAWIREIIRPLADADPECARFMAEGALMRMVCGQRCFERYSTELRGAARSASSHAAIEEVLC
jgi:hypothetical protein